MDLKESARQWVLRELPYDRSDAALVADLASRDAHGLLVVYHNWMSRLVRPQPRVVHRSNAFLQNPLTLQRANDLALLIGDIEQGHDLKKYLSRDVERAAAKPRGAKRRPDLDLTLNNWGVHHLHISSIVEADGFVKRDGPLLFIVFKTDVAYLIDIMKHGDWTRDHVLAVLADEWPNDGVIHKIPNATNANKVTEDQRGNLRKNHYNSAFVHKGSVYMPGAGMIGMMSDGTTIAAWKAARQLLKKIETLERALDDDPRCLVNDFAQRGLNFPADPDFQFAITEDGPGIIERKTNAWISLQ